MSIQAHPNIHAVKTMHDVQKVLLENLRGLAEKHKKDLEFFLLDEACKFAIHVSEKLDDAIGVENGEPKN